MVALEHHHLGRLERGRDDDADDEDGGQDPVRGRVVEGVEDREEHEGEAAEAAKHDGDDVVGCLALAHRARDAAEVAEVALGDERERVEDEGEGSARNEECAVGGSDVAAERQQGLATAWNHQVTTAVWLAHLMKTTVVSSTLYALWSSSTIHHSSKPSRVASQNTAASAGRIQ